MALPSATIVATAARNLALVALEDRTVSGSAKLFQLVNEALAAAARISPSTYAGLSIPHEVYTGLDTLNHIAQFLNTEDEALADVAALVSALGISVGDSFVVNTATNDLTDNALATAKGSAVAVGDVFMLITATTVLYISTQASLTN